MRTYTGLQHRLVRFITVIMVAGSCLIAVQAQSPDNDPCTITDHDLDTASGNVTKLHDTLMTAMQQAQTLEFSGRYRLLEPVISDIFNTPLITRTILGRRYWESLTPQQMQDFEALFLELSIATYADRFDSFEGESFIELEKKALPARGTCPPQDGREAPAKRIIVKTELQRTNDEPVSLEYLQQEIDGKWYIITVIADGVNDLSLKRGEYTDVIKQRGFDSLMDDLRQKISDMANPAD